MRFVLVVEMTILVMKSQALVMFFVPLKTKEDVKLIVCQMLPFEKNPAVTAQ